jgi:hypothetical protein
MWLKFLFLTDEVKIEKNIFIWKLDIFVLFL